MTRNDYEVIAAAIRYSDLSSDDKIRVGRILARALSNQSHKCNYGRFLIACDPDSVFTYIGKKYVWSEKATSQ